MKKLLVLLLALTLCFTLAACGGGDDPCTEHVDANSDGKCDNCDAAVEPDESNGGTTPTGTIELVKGGAATFQIVSTEETATLVGKNLTNFVKTLNQCIEDGNVASVYENAEVKDVEIILGTLTSRGDAYTENSIDPYAYGYEGWSVQIIGTKIVVLGGSSGAYKDALAYLEETVFGIDVTTVSVDNVNMTAEQAKTEEQTKFDVTVTIAGNPLKEYVFAVNTDDPTAVTAINAVRNQLFKRTGAYIKTVNASKLTEGQKAIWVETLELNGERTTSEGARIYVEDGSLHIETEFENKLEELVYDYLVTEIAESKKSTVTVKADLNKAIDVRNIYYKDYGTRGDGQTDDFDAIKECHDYANLYGHTVNADPDAIYYIDGTHGREYISVRTDTNWHGCKFIFDDSNIDPTDPARSTPIFRLESDYSTVTYSGDTLPFTTLASGATDLGGWAPGFPALIVIYNEDIKQFIRYGANEGDDYQQEILKVDENGNIDPSTPVQWDYAKVTKIVVYHTDDKAITVSGGTADNRANVDTVFNGAPSYYTYYWRNIYITRSNSTLENIVHTISEDIPTAEGGTGAPYQGFTLVRNCSDVTIKGITYQHPEWRYLATDSQNRMGSYEMNASHANNVLWYGCDQSNFFNADGSVTFHGMMGTSFCKNLNFDQMFVCSFDAHQGVYNATIKNSTVEHMNFIGDGLITVENVTVYVDGTQHAAMNLRDDYGSTWWGDVKIDGLTLKYSNDTDSYQDISIMRVYWNNWDFGYTTSLPQNMWIKDVIIQQFSYSVDANGVRSENILATNDRAVSLFTKNVAQNVNDLSDPNELIDNAIPNINPMEGTKTVTLINKNPDKPILIIWPTAKQFKDLDVTVDGVLIIENGEAVTE